MAKEVGSTWLANIGGKLWPVVLCGDEAAPPAFIALRTNPAHMPAIQLGRHKYVFVDDRALHSFDPHKNYMGLLAYPEKEIQKGGSEEVKEEQQRRSAFSDDALRYGDHLFWANYIAQRSKIRRLEQEPRGAPRTPQRQQGMSHRREVVDLEAAKPNYSQGFVPAMKRQKLGMNKSSHQLLTPTQTPRQPRHQEGDTTEAIVISDGDDSDSDEDDADDETMTVPASYLGTIGTSTQDSRGIFSSVEDSTGAARPTKSSVSSHDRAPGPHECVLIFAHGERERLVIGKSVVAKCSFLNNRRADDPDDEGATQLSLVEDKRANDVKLTASDLHAVLQFYQSGDIGPRLINKPDQEPAISQLDLSANRKAGHIELFGKAFLAAVKIEDEDLQSLIYQKLQVLGPSSPLMILSLAGYVSDLAELATPGDEISTWATDLVQKYYWILARKQTKVIQRTLERNNVMRAAIYDYLRDNPSAGMEGWGDRDF